MVKKTSFLGTDNLQLMTINYNNEESINDLEAVDFNNDIQMSDVNDTDLKKKLQQHNGQVKKIVKKYRNLRRKKAYEKVSKKK